MAMADDGGIFRRRYLVEGIVIASRVAPFGLLRGKLWIYFHGSDDGDARCRAPCWRHPFGAGTDLGGQVVGRRGIYRVIED